MRASIALCASISRRVSSGPLGSSWPPVSRVRAKRSMPTGQRPERAGDSPQQQRQAADQHDVEDQRLADDPARASACSGLGPRARGRRSIRFSPLRCRPGHDASRRRPSCGRMRRCSRIRRCHHIGVVDRPCGWSPPVRRIDALFGQDRAQAFLALQIVRFAADAAARRSVRSMRRRCQRCLAAWLVGARARRGNRSAVRTRAGTPGRSPRPFRGAAPARGPASTAEIVCATSSAAATANSIWPSRLLGPQAEFHGALRRGCPHTRRTSAAQHIAAAAHRLDQLRVRARRLRSCGAGG